MTDYQRQWRRANKDKVREASRRLRQRKQAIIKAAKAGGCEECGTDADLLFHHPEGDNPYPSNRRSMNNLSYADLEREIARCVVMCRSCHTLLHLEGT